MQNPLVDRKALAAALLGCAPEELLGFRDEGLSGVVLVAPDGRKLRYPEELLRRAQAWYIEDLAAGNAPAEQDSVQRGLSEQTPLPATGGKKSPTKKGGRP